MLGLDQLIETVASSNATVHPPAETGTGKEMVARAIHQSSLRRQQRFVAAANAERFPSLCSRPERFTRVPRRVHGCGR